MLTVEKFPHHICHIKNLVMNIEKGIRKIWQSMPKEVKTFSQHFLYNPIAMTADDRQLKNQLHGETLIVSPYLLLSEVKTRKECN